MSRLSDKKLALLQSDYSSSLWYITKQNCSFRDLMMMASILERWNDDPDESFESFFNRVKTETKYANYIGNSPHRALKNCEFYGIMSPSGSRVAYTASNLTDIYYTVKSLCNENYAETNKYQQIIDKQIENMNITVDGNDLKPVLFTLKVMLVVGDATGNYELSLQEFKLFVCTAKEWCQYFESAESILRSREDGEYLSAALQNYDIANDTRFNLVFKNLSYVESTTKSIIIDKNKIEEVRRKVAEFEVGDFWENRETILKNNEKDSKEVPFDPDAPLQQIFYGAPGTGKSHEIKEKTKGESVIRTTFHPDSDYSTFVGAYKPTMDEMDSKVIPVVLGESGTVFNKNEGTYKEQRIVYQFVMQAFMKAYLGAWKKFAETNGDAVKPQFLVIEEINRGNCAQIFGDLFQLLDRGKRGFSEYPIEADNDLQREIEQAFKEHKDYKLKEGVKINAEGVVKDYVSNYGATLSEDIQEGRILLFPPNLHIWATMNTSDQSLFPIDSAFKRRWEWKYTPIAQGKDEHGHLMKWQIEGQGENSWWTFVQGINEVIDVTTHSEDKKLGFFFCKDQNGVIKKETFVNKVVFYLWNDVFKVYGFKSEIFDKNVKDDKTEKITFKSFYKDDGSVNEETMSVFVKNVMAKAPKENSNDEVPESEEISEESETEA